MLARDFGLGPRGKANPMRSTPADRRSVDDPLFSDVFGGQPKYRSSSNSPNNSKFMSQGDFDYDSIFHSSSASEPKTSNNTSKSSSMPVYDKPVYDDDIFDGLPGLKSKSEGSKLRFEDDVFASISSPATDKNLNQSSGFDDLLGNLGTNEKFGENKKSNSAKSNANSEGFDDLLPGFGGGSSAASNRRVPESRWGSVPAAGSKHGNSLDNPFVVLESSSQQSTSSGMFTDPLEEIGKLNKSRSTKAEVSSGNGGGGAFDDLDPLSTMGKSTRSLSPRRDSRRKDGSPSRSATPHSATVREPVGNNPFEHLDSTEKRVPVDNFQEPPLFDVPNVATDFERSFGQTAPPPEYYETGSHTDMPSGAGQEHQIDDIWLTVSEIPLFTQPSSAPPPSRPPPPIPHRGSKSKKRGEESSSPSNYSQHTQTPNPSKPAAKGSAVSQFDELEEFAMGGAHNSFDDANLPFSADPDSFSAAAASAAAMKDAMDKAEAKFRHAKEAREREYAKAARNKESGHVEKDEQEAQDRELRETQERLDRERKQKEEEEKERRRIERERQREIEREKARQAVERATREARERAAAEARERAAAEARLKSERAAVEKANAEARARAERAAVQRAQAEARERAAAEAKERAERAAAEAKERAEKAAAEVREKAAVAEARERELRDKAAAARAETEARRRAERAAVERAAAEARERAAAEARERAAAAAAAKMNQQKNDNDLEAFFSMGRASSAPRARTNSADPFFDQQFPSTGGFEAAKKTASSTGASSTMKKASSSTNFDDLSSIFGAAPSGEFQEVDGETEERRRARLERHQRTQERAAKALAEKNQRDFQAQREQEERHRIAETLDIEIKRWAAGKEGNLRALLSTLQYVLWPECGWQPVSLTDLITGASVKKAYRKATLCIHPDKVQQKGATLQQKYIAEKVFDLLKEAWNKFNSEELF